MGTFFPKIVEIARAWRSHIRFFQYPIRVWSSNGQFKDTALYQTNDTLLYKHDTSPYHQWYFSVSPYQEWYKIQNGKRYGMIHIIWRICAGDIAARIYQPGYSGYRGERQKIYLVLEYEYRLSLTSSSIIVRLSAPQENLLLSSRPYSFPGGPRLG